MRDDRIMIEPFNLLNMLEFTMKKQVNQHTEVRFAGHIADAAAQEYLEASLDRTWVKVVVLQSMEPEERKKILTAVANSPVRPAVDVLLGKSFAKATNQAEKAAIDTLVKEYSDKRAGGIVDGNHQTLKIGDLIAPYALRQLGDLVPFINLLEARDALDVLNALGASEVLKAKGFHQILGILNQINSGGLLNDSPETAAKSDIAVELLSDKKILLLGVLTDFRIEVDNGVKVARGIVRSATCLMDTMPHIRTWHAPDINYDKIVRTYLPLYPQGAYAMTVEDKKIAGLVVQYEETDWAFTIRMASHFNRFIIPNDGTKDGSDQKADSEQPGVKFYFGMPNFETVEFAENTYVVKKDLQEYRYKRDNQVPDLQEKDMIYYIVKSREIYPLGGQVRLNERKLYIARIDTALAGSELYHHYHLKEKNGFQEPRQYNFKLLGASLPANIHDVTKEVVQIVVQPDENQANAGFRWFSYSTVYSSPDGTGWYCMPEPGDEVRLYLPNEDETNGYVISATHLCSSAGDERVNPNNKSIMNKQGKEVLFTPGSVTFTNNAGMSIELIDGEGIRIVSNKKIKMIAQEEVSISSATATMEINAPESITVNQNGTYTKLADDLVIKGKRVFVE